MIISDQKPKWLNNDIINIIRDRDSFYKKARRSGNQDDWNIARFVKSRVQMAIKTYKSEKIKQERDRYKNNPTKFGRN